MKEIVQLYAGCDGSSIGLDFTRMISTEHGLSPAGHVTCGSWSQMEAVHVMFSESSDHRFQPRKVDIGNRFNIDQVRKQVELCDTLDGFLFCHNTDDQVITSRVLSEVRDEFPTCLIATGSVMTPNKSEESKMHHAKTFSDMINFSDVNILIDFCDTGYNHLVHPSERNHLAARTLSDVTAAMRQVNKRRKHMK